jgi:1A family penicillin-binding protein
MKLSKKHLSRIFRIDARDIFVAFLSLLAVAVFIPLFTYVYFAQDLTTPDRIMNRNDTGVTLLDEQNRPFFTFYSAKNRKIIPIETMPKVVQEAVIAVEDKDFYSHPGFSIKGIFRSLLADVKTGETAQGGSTLTQQLVKNALLTPSKNFLRKYQEIVLASEIERRYTKTQILEMYLNSVYFGNGAFGIEEAAETYFGKKASDLNLAEGSYLAGLLPAPTQFSKVESEAKLRQKIVLNDMTDQGFINQDEKQQALNEKLSFKSLDDHMNAIAPHFALMVRDELLKKYGEERISRSGFKVRTSLNIDWQAYAEKVVKNQVINLRYNNVSNGSAVVMDPKTGQIKVLVGSSDWYDEKFGKVNIATSLRQPGSSFKPFVYVTAMERHLITPATLLKDQQTTFPGNYTPHDYDGKYRGMVTTRRALSNSLNIPAVQVMSMIGVDGAIDTAKSFGISTLSDPSNYGLSLVLGAGEVKLIDMVQAYGVFANSGVRVKPQLILDIEDKHNQVVYSSTTEQERVIDSEYTFLISSILSDNKARAEEFGNTLTINRPAAVKTGTTENYRDAWTMGYTPSLVVGSWVGNNDGKPMDNIAGSLGAAPIWKQLMEKFLEGKPVEEFTPPDGVVKTSACIVYRSLDGKTATPSAISEYFVEGTQPKNLCVSSAPSVSGLPAISVTPMPLPTSSAQNQSQPTFAPPATQAPTAIQSRPTQSQPTTLPTFTPAPTKKVTFNFHSRRD